MRGLGLLLGLMLALVGRAWGAGLVSADGGLTEIVYALGGEAQLVGTDTTSTWPPAAAALPKVGYKRALAAEGILSLRPDRVLVTGEAGPPAVLEQLRAAGVAVQVLPDAPGFDALAARVRGVAAVLGRGAAGEALLAQVRRDLARAAALAVGPPPRVLFLLDIGRGAPLAAGAGTGADAMIRLAGGINVLEAAFDGYKPLNPEAALAAAPEVVLLTERNLASLGGVEGLRALPGLAATPALAAGRVVAMDSLYLLGFGPRLGQAAADLARRLREVP